MSKYDASAKVIATAIINNEPVTEIMLATMRAASEAGRSWKGVAIISSTEIKSDQMVHTLAIARALKPEMTPEAGWIKISMPKEGTSLEIIRGTGEAPIIAKQKSDSSTPVPVTPIPVTPESLREYAESLREKANQLDEEAIAMERKARRLAILEAMSEEELDALEAAHVII